MSFAASVSAPSTPTEQVKQIHNASAKKKAKHSNRVHFPVDEMLVTCYLEPPDPWSKVYGNTINTLISAYVAACDKQGIKPLPCVLDQLQIIPTIVVLFSNSLVASDELVKKLSVVMLLPHPVNGSSSFRITNSFSRVEAPLFSSFSNYGNPFMIYLLLTSDASQNLIPNLSSLFSMYCVNLLLALVGKAVHQ
ncbi:protein phosphatase 1 regulatory subunit 37 [Trichonephila clavipes]|nr:protein phosphatase 1 regulatory subunit 37 [Trichonephila clavipes]